ncbi:hypothetical protein LP417_26705 [Polaromonas sp. P1-6]|nr:hypothetical protein LP417_26705 [Polaromonas sp. P1-6]UUZ68970.1 hypothetical protein LP416_03935 [Polaromonas sp. P2-4]
MRHLLLVLMIALLPLRGWVGDAMATSMTAGQLQQQVATKIIATHAHQSAAQDHFNHETAAPEAVHAVAAVPDCTVDASDDTSHAAGTHCESCAACQACHTVALSPTAADVNAVFNLRTLPRAAVAQFASAEAALGQKPPIS